MAYIFYLLILCILFYNFFLCTLHYNNNKFNESCNCVEGRLLCLLSEKYVFNFFFLNMPKNNNGNSIFCNKQCRVL